LVRCHREVGFFFQPDVVLFSRQVQQAFTQHFFRKVAEYPRHRRTCLRYFCLCVCNENQVINGGENLVRKSHSLFCLLTLSNLTIDGKDGNLSLGYPNGSYEDGNVQL